MIALVFLFFSHELLCERGFQHTKPESARHWLVIKRVPIRTPVCILTAVIEIVFIIKVPLLTFLIAVLRVGAFFGSHQPVVLVDLTGRGSLS